MAANHLEVLHKLYDDFAKGDVPAVLAALDPNIRWTEAEGFPYGGTYNGPEEITEKVFMKLGTEWDNWTVDVQEIVNGGDHLVALGKYRATYKATGKSMEADMAHAWTFRDGKAIRFVQYVDSAIVNKALE